MTDKHPDSPVPEDQELGCALWKAHWLATGRGDGSVTWWTLQPVERKWWLDTAENLAPFLERLADRTPAERPVAGPDDPDRIFTSEQRIAAYRLRLCTEATRMGALHRLYETADTELNRALADAGYMPKREAEVTIRIEVLAEVDDEALP